MLEFAKRALSVPAVFDTYQSLMGAPRCHCHFITDILQPRAGERVLDIGCGVGASVRYIPQATKYVGIDLSEAYIDQARKTHGSRGEFHRIDVSDVRSDILGKFDSAFAFGVLHHLPDDIVAKTVELVRDVVVPGGRFVTIDPCYVDGQHWLAKKLIDNDRGDYIRDAARFRDLLLPLGEVRTTVHHDLLRVPYTQIIMQVTLP